MNTADTTWTPLSERQPTEIELPAYFTDGHVINLVQPSSDLGHWVVKSSGFTHWRRVELPPLPPREKTQAEKDRDAFWSWHSLLTTLESKAAGNADSEEAYQAALAHERSHLGNISAEQHMKELREIWEQFRSGSVEGTAYEAYHRLKALLYRAAKG